MCKFHFYFNRKLRSCVQSPEINIDHDGDSEPCIGACYKHHFSKGVMVRIPWDRPDVDLGYEPNCLDPRMLTLVISLLSWEKCSNLFWPFSIRLWNCRSVRLLGKVGSQKMVSRGLGDEVWPILLWL